MAKKMNTFTQDTGRRDRHIGTWTFNEGTECGQGEGGQIKEREEGQSEDRS